MVLFSFIIPHKNSSALLKRLLDSIPSDLDIQIIVVDDNSSEEEFKEIQSFVKDYSIELYQNEGKYAGGARNTGLKYAIGKWVLFADSDDYYTENASQLIKKHIDSDSDIVFFNAISKYSDSGENAYRAEHIQNLIYKASSQGNLDALRYCHTVPWGKMIKRQLIIKHNIRFDEVIAGNDMMFSVLCGIKAESVWFDKAPLYCVTVTYGSITTTLTKDRFDSRFSVTLKVNNLLKKEGHGKYQISILYFIAKSYQFGIGYMFHVFFACISNHSNFFIGSRKLLNIQSVLRDRQNIRGERE
mgnify:CR=1 FL=1